MENVTVIGINLMKHGAAADGSVVFPKKEILRKLVP